VIFISSPKLQYWCHITSPLQLEGGELWLPHPKPIAEGIKTLPALKCEQWIDYCSVASWEKEQASDVRNAAVGFGARSEQCRFQPRSRIQARFHQDLRRKATLCSVPNPGQGQDRRIGVHFTYSNTCWMSAVLQTQDWEKGVGQGWRQLVASLLSRGSWSLRAPQAFAIRGRSCLEESTV
jgi:hypothetical protein